MKTYLFIHGAWHGKWCWKKVLEILKGKNIKAYAIDLPGHGAKNSMKEVFLSDYVDYCVSYIKEKNLKDIILVGHSFAGVVISRLAEEIPERISKLVYLAGIVLDNECFLDIIPKEIAADFRNQAKKGSCLNLPEEAIHHLFISSIDRKDVRFKLVLKNLTPQPAYPFFEKVFFVSINLVKLFSKLKNISLCSLQLIQ